jgi:hypothetical protein
LFDHARVSGKPSPPVPVEDLHVILHLAAHHLSKARANDLGGISTEDLQRRFEGSDPVRANAAREIVGHAFAGTLKTEMLGSVDALVLTMITCVVEVIAWQDQVANC